jgi:hypothetical protein
MQVLLGSYPHLLLARLSLHVPRAVSCVFPSLPVSSPVMDMVLRSGRGRANTLVSIYPRSTKYSRDLYAILLGSLLL